MISAGVAAKAVVMAALVTLLAATSFVQSVILVLVSATATGVFGLLIVLVQAHSERSLHERIDRLDAKAAAAVGATQAIKDQTQAIAEKVAETGTA